MNSAVLMIGVAIVSILIAAAGIRMLNRRVVIAIVISAWIIAPIVFLVWNEGTANAQTKTCVISQITDTLGTNLNGGPLINGVGTRVAFSSNRDLTFNNPDGNFEIFVYFTASGFVQVTNTSGGANSQPSISNTGRVAFISNRDLTGGNADGNDEVFLYDFNSSAFTQVTNTTLVSGIGHQQGPRIAGSGMFIAFVSDGNLTGSNPDNSWEYFRYDITAGSTTQITNSTGPNFNFAPSITDNGTRIAFLSTIDPNGTNADRNGEIFVYDFVTLSFSQVTSTTNPTTFEPPSLDPGGRFIAFSANYDPLGSNPDGNFEIFVWDATNPLTVSQVTNSAFGSFSAQISGNGTHVAFQSNGDHTGGNPELNTEVFLYNMASAVTTQLTVTPVSGLSQLPSINDNGSIIAFVSNSDVTGGNPDGNDEIFLTSCSPPSTPTPTPGSSSKIVFSTDRDGNNEIYVMNDDGSSPTNLSNDPADDLDPAWSPNGLKIAFSSDRSGGSHRIHVMNADGSNPTSLTDQLEFDPAWSPDGSKIAFMSLRDGNEEIYVMNANGTGQMNLTNTSSTVFDGEPSWSPDGTKIAFTSNRDGNAEIYVMNSDGSNPVRLTNNMVSDYTPAWSPDGSKIAFGQAANGGSNSNIVSMNPDGSGQTPVALGGVYVSPAWSHDSSKIAFSSQVFTTDWDIYVVDVTGPPNPVNITNDPGGDTAPDWRLVPTFVPGNTFVVNQPDDLGDGTCDVTCTLRDAVNEAAVTSSDDIIVFDPSLTAITLNGFNLEIQNVTGTIAINGPGADKLTIDGGSSSDNRVFYISNSTISITGVTITGGDGNGTSPDLGGAIYASGALTLDGVYLTGNTAFGSGGGVYFDTGNHRIRNSTIAGNTAGSSTSDGGGGFFNNDATVTVANSTIVQNTAGYGGGFANQSLNTAATLRNVTITANTTSTGMGGGGLWNQGTADIANSIIAGNSGGFGSPPEINNSGTTTSTGSSLVGDSPGDAEFTLNPITYQPSDVLNTPPLLIAFGNYGGSVPTHPLQISSPAKDAGDSTLAVDPFDNSPLLTDQRGTGFSRNMDGGVDIGAFEVQDNRYYVTVTTDDPEGGACDDQCSLREAAWLISQSGSQAATIDFARIFNSSTPIQLSGTSSIGLVGNVTVAGYDARDVVIQGVTLGVFGVNGNVKITGVTVYNGSRHSTPGGGGIQVNGGSLTLERVMINANSISAGTGGGVVFAGGTNHRIVDSTFASNIAGTSGCGGLSLTTGTLSIANSTFHGNSANSTFGGGGAICVTGGSATLRNVTISGNSASTGGGIHQTGGAIDIGNSIVAGNSATGSNPPEINFVGGTFTSSGNNFIGDSPGDSTNTGNPVAWTPLDLVNGPPLLGPLQDNGGTTLTMEPQAGSPIIDNGSNALAVDPYLNAPLAFDQRGFTRIFGATVDIGAVEAGSSVPPPPTPTPTPTPTVTPTPTPTPPPGTPKIAFSSSRQASVFDVFVMDVNGANQTRLTPFDINEESDPTWSPDGSKIAFTSNRDGNFEIYVMNSDGSNQQRLTYFSGVDHMPSWSADGSRIAFTRGPGLSSNTRWIMTMTASGTDVRQITTTNGVFSDQPSWSPDGTKIVFSRQGASPSGREIYVVNSDGSNGANPVRLTNNFPAFDNYPAWSPDGTRIAFTSDRDEPGNWEIYVMNPDGTGAVRLTNHPDTDWGASWSPDSAQILFTKSTASTAEVFVMNADGNYPTNISNNVAPDSQPVWQPNVAWAVPTGTGSNVNVQAGVVSVTFSGVTQAGTTTQYPIDPNSAGPPPSGYMFVPGYPAYEISTTAVYTPPVIVCIQVPAVTHPVEFSLLKIFHFQNGALQDVTISRDFPSRSVCGQVNSLSPFVIARPLAPTAANVSVGGRVTSADGMPIARARVMLTDPQGTVRTVVTNNFGRYRFDDVAAGRIYMLSVSAKQYQFEPQSVHVQDEIADLDLVALPEK